MPIKFNRPESIVDSPLTKLENHAEFVRRHIGPDDEHVTQMLTALGVGSLDE